MKLRPLVFAALLACASFQASAVMPVIDSSNLAQAVKQVQAWGDQYKQMKMQIDALHFQIESMTGDRGMSKLLPALGTTLPPDWAKSMSNLSALATQIRKSQAVLTPAQAAYLSKDLQKFLSQSQDVSAANQAMAQSAFNDAVTRQSRLQALTSALATTADPKAAYDLANRIAIEHTALLNDQEQLQAAAGAAAAQERAQRLMIDQMRAASFGTQIPTIDKSLP